MTVIAACLNFTQSNKWSYLRGQTYGFGIDAFTFLEAGKLNLKNLGKTYLIKHDDKRLPHVPFNTASWLIVSEPIANIFLKYVDNQVQLFPIKIFSKNKTVVPDYWAVKIKNEKAAANLKESDFLIDPETGKIRYFYRLVLSRQSLVPEDEIFRLKEHFSYIIVTNNLLRAVKKVERSCLKACVLK